MKHLGTILILAICIAACNSETKQQAENKKLEQIVKTQPAGTIIAADSIPYNKLNNFHFAVTVKTTEASDKGTYAIETTMGHNTAASKFTMPRGAENVVPVMHRVADSTAFIIGFYYGSDTTFYDYYQVNAIMDNIEMKYTKAYRLK
ncbi:MAG: hypothetical protein EOP51_12430 [Sphingobacteriales bacterium]|nr:MAG: hypothetical protein EOP51_12430 [Sphingobacteriales bacterium]